MLGVLGALALLALAAGRGRAQETAAAVPELGSGADIYTHLCQGCHMPDGRGASGAGRYPALAGDPALASWQLVAVTVLNGRKGMPAFGSWSWMGPLRLGVHLSDAQVAAVVNYVRTHFGNHWRKRVSVEQVKTLPHPVESAHD